MKFDEAVDTIHEVAARNGEPLTRDVCEHIAKKLFGVVHIPDAEPGNIARKQRERYQGQTAAELAKTDVVYINNEA